MTGARNRQQQFLEVIDRDEAERRFHAALPLEPLGTEIVPLSNALGRVLGEDVAAPVNVPSFDRSNFDGFAVRASDTFGAAEESPRRLRLLDKVIATAVVPTFSIEAGSCAAIATGGMIPRGADGVVLVEHTEVVESNDEDAILIHKPVASGFGVSFTGSDIASGETVLRRGQQLTSRETGLLAAIGIADVVLYRRPRVAIVSTGDEIVAPGKMLEPAKVYDSNARILADAVRELGGEPIELGIVSDDVARLDAVVRTALHESDFVLMSGGTSKGAGDLSYRVVQKLNNPGIVAHGVALKPGKPVCLAVTDGKPVVILPGFPTSAIFTFHEFVAPVIRMLGGRRADNHQSVSARLAVKVNSVIGRKEYNLVGLVHAPSSQGNASGPKYVAYPMGKGSGSVTTFSHADGFVAIDRNQEIVEANERIEVQLLGRDLSIADLVVIGSHCLGLDYLLGRLREKGLNAKFLAVGSTAGLAAAERGECDIAGVHLFDAESDRYNLPFVTDGLTLVRGYDRRQGIIYRADDRRFEAKTVAEIIASACDDDECLMINRNRGSGTRILTDSLLGGRQPNGYAVQAKTHTAVAAAVLQRRADWGIAVETVAKAPDLGFLPVRNEQFDFVIPKRRANRESVRAFCELLEDSEVRRELAVRLRNRV